MLGRVVFQKTHDVILLSGSKVIPFPLDVLMFLGGWHCPVARDVAVP